MKGRIYQKQMHFRMKGGKFIVGGAPRPSYPVLIDAKTGERTQTPEQPTVSIEIDEKTGKATLLDSNQPDSK